MNKQRLYTFSCKTKNETRPEPHGGYPGCQWIYETSPSGRVAKTVPTLVRAYTMCVSAKAARTEKEVRFAESKRIAEEKQKAKDDAAKLAYQRKVSHYTKLLCDSLGMHYFPERIIRGVRRPAEWLPSFNLDVMKEVETSFGVLVAKDIIAGAKVVSEKQAARMIQAEDEKRWKEEERKAMILANAMLKANVRHERTTTSPVSPVVSPIHNGTAEDPQ